MMYRAALVVVCLVGCGGDMPSDRYFRPYQQIGAEQMNNSAMGCSGTAANLVSNTLAVYEGSRRWQQTSYFNYPTDYSDTSWQLIYVPGAGYTDGIKEGTRAKILVLDGRDVLTGSSGHVRLNIMLGTYDHTHPVTIYFTVGRNSTSLYYDAASNAGYWVHLDLEVGVLPAGEEIPIIIEAGAASGDGDNVIYVSAIGIYEYDGERSKPAYVDLSSSLIGDPDYPCSPFVMNTLNKQNEVLRSTKNNRTLISQCYKKQILGATGAPVADYADPTNMRNLGEWSLLKGTGPTTLAAKVRYKIVGGAGEKMTLTARLYPFWVLDHDGQTANFTTGDWLHGTTSHARAKIIHQVDHGDNGHLYLSHLSGTFANDEAIVTVAGGAAVANGTADAPDVTEYIDAVDTTLTWAADEWEWTDVTFSNNIIAGEAEYELRLDAKINTGTPDLFYVSNIFVAEPLVGASEVAFVLPNIHDCEINDDVCASTLDRIRTTQQQVYERGRKILVNDFRQGDNKINSADYTILTHGVVFPSCGSKFLTLRAQLSKPNQESRTSVTYNAAGGGFNVGEKVVYQVLTDGGATWATVATGEVADEDTTGNVLYIKNAAGVIATSTDVTKARIASTDGTRTAMPSQWQRSVDPGDVQVLLKFGLLADLNAIDYTTALLVSQEIDVEGMGMADQPFTVTMRVPIPETYWNTYASAGTMPGPLVFVLLGKNTVGGTEYNYDFVKLLKSYVYEEPQTVLTDY
jgi:hypothetical protein